MSNHRFPDDFLWGVATSAPQIEGATAEGGRGRSIWDTFAATPGNIDDKSNLLVACDHYHRWPEDVRLLKWLGVNAYRFSIAWPRVLPEGRGAVNMRGLDFYDSLVDALLEAGIRPFVTLYHWDLPQTLQDQGGWATRSTAKAFVEYTAAVTSRLGDRVKDWTTHNEPWCVAHLGHESGDHAPGHRDPAESLRVAHHLLLSHGWATDVIRSNAPGSEVGIVLNLTPATPATDSDLDLDAARWFEGFFNRWYLDPLFRGEYPADVVADRIKRGHLSGTDLPFVHKGDLDTISAPTDYLGINYYSRVVMRMNPGGEPEAVVVVPREELTEMGWEVFPSGLSDLLGRVHEEYRPPKIYITENGAAYSDDPGADGRINDEKRIAYLRSHLSATHQAIEAGVPVAGYFVWSLMDNFEWGHGYEKRFGLYRVDFETQKRMPKDSAAWYRGVVAAREIESAAMNRM